MRSRLVPWLVCLLGTTACTTAFAQDNPEDEPLVDEPIPTAPAAPDAGAATVPGEPSSAPNTAPQTAAPLTPDTPASSAAGDVVTIPRAVWEQLQRDVEELKRSRGAQPATGTTGDIAATGTDGTTADGTTTTTGTAIAITCYCRTFRSWGRPKACSAPTVAMTTAAALVWRKAK
jgi:hypothetical protein